MAEQLPDAQSPSTGATLLRGLLALLWIVLGSYLGLQAFQPRVEPAGPEAPSTAFSAGRAMEHVETLAATPRPTGSPAHAEARRYLQTELRALGLETEVQRTTVAWGRSRGRVQAVEVANLLGLLPGRRGDDPALALMAHYDSVPTAPGAADDASGVAVILETVRALKAEGPLEHDLMVLLTDAEEMGMFGAQAFALRHPWVKRTGVVINLEARGASGPPMMFRTSRGNGALIGALAAVPHPAATSLTDAVFQRMPNDTDLSRTLAAGVPGMDFAILGDTTRYHSVLDRPDQLSAASLQQEGENLLALVRRLDREELDSLRRSDVVYFSLFGRLWTYPASWGLLLGVLCLVLFAAALFLAARALGRAGGDGGFSALLGRSVGGVLFILVGGVLGWLGVTLVVQQALGLDKDFRGAPWGTTYELASYGPGLLLLAVALALLVAVFARRWLGLGGALGAGLLWSLLALAAALLLPGGGYLFALPALVSLGAWALALLLGGAQRPFSGWISWALAALGALPALLLVPAITWLLMVGLGLPFAPVVAILAALTVPLILPLLEPWAGRPRLLAALALPAAVGVVALALVIPPIFATVSGTPEAPRSNNLFYALDADNGEALWATSDPVLQPWQRQVMGESPETRDLLELTWRGSRGGFLTQAAPTLPLPPPRIEATAVAEMTEDGSTYVMPLRITSQREAPVFHLGIESLAAVSKMRINDWTWDFRDRPFHSRDELGWLLSFAGQGGRPVELTLELTDRQPVRFVVVDQSYELPRAPGLPPRPPESAARASDWLTDSTLVKAETQL